MSNKTGMPEGYEGAIAVIATSKEAGEEYVEALGITDDYVVISDWAKGQGLRARLIVITPGYFLAAHRAMAEAEEKATRSLTQSLQMQTRYNLNLG